MYALYQGSAEQACVDQPASTLDRLNILAEGAEFVGDTIERFIARFDGVGVSAVNAQLAGASSTPPRPIGHRHTIERLATALERADKLARELQTIG